MSVLTLRASFTLVAELCITDRKTSAGEITGDVGMKAKKCRKPEDICKISRNIWKSRDKFLKKWRKLGVDKG